MTGVGRTAGAAHSALMVVLTAVVVGDPGGRRRRRADYPEYVSSFQQLDPIMRRVAPPLFLSAIGAGVLTAASTARSDPVSASLRALSAGLVAAAVRVTLTVNVPINVRMGTWDPERPVPGWQQDRERWERGHRVRSVLVLGGAVATVAAARPRPSQDLCHPEGAA